MNDLFNEKFTEFLNQKAYTLIPSRERYDSILAAVLKRDEPEQNNNKLTSSERKWISKGNKRVPIQEELFDLINASHIRLIHAGRDILKNDLDNYWGLSREIISIYLSLCKECELKKAKVKKGLTVHPIESAKFNSRGQVDLIDLQTRPDGEYRFIMVYQDHLTKFVVLNALKQKTANQVAYHLIRIFAIFGSPNILQSDNGKEFCNQVIKEVVRKWPECHLIHGKPRHSQSQGSVERANRDIGDMLTIWLRDNRSTKWSDALPYVQAAKNQRLHSGIGRSPYEAVFGSKMQIGSKGKAVDEEDQEQSDEEREQTEDQEEGFVTIDGSDWVTDVDNRVVQLELEDRTISDEEEEFIIRDFFDERDENIAQHRDGAKQKQHKQAVQMLRSSAKKFPPLQVGQSVRVPVPDFDRSKIDHRNVLGVVQEVSEYGLYKIGTKSGTLHQMYSRNQVEPCSSQHLAPEDVPKVKIALRAAVGGDSLSGKQGFVHCSCTTKCETKRCKCLKLGRMCNSRCHNSLSCANK